MDRDGKSRKHALEHAAQAAGGPLSTRGLYQRIAFKDTVLSVYLEDDNEQSEILSIPLPSCDVVHVKQNCSKLRVSKGTDASHILALGPRQEQSPPWRKSAVEDPEAHSTLKGMDVDNELWLLCIGGANNLVVYQLLMELGSRGAIRWDLDSCYQIGSLLGSGACGTVYLGSACDPLTKAPSSSDKDTDWMFQREVAVKQFRTDQPVSSILEEVKYLALTRGHPNILPMVSLFCSEDGNGEEELKKQDKAKMADGRSSAHKDPSSSSLHYSIVLQLCRHGDLFDFVCAGPVADEVNTEIMIGLSSALAHLHNLGIVHRDVKPENIMLDGSRPLLADMGIAGRLDDLEDMVRRVGTPGFCAPELVMKVVPKDINEKQGQRLIVFADI